MSVFPLLPMHLQATHHLNLHIAIVSAHPQQDKPFWTSSKSDLAIYRRGKSTSKQITRGICNICARDAESRSYRPSHTAIQAHLLLPDLDPGCFPYVVGFGDLSLQAFATIIARNCLNEIFIISELVTSLSKALCSRNHVSWFHLRNSISNKEVKSTCVSWMIDLFWKGDRGHRRVDTDFKIPDHLSQVEARFTYRDFAMVKLTLLNELTVAETLMIFCWVYNAFPICVYLPGNHHCHCWALDHDRPRPGLLNQCSTDIHAQGQMVAGFQTLNENLQLCVDALVESIWFDQFDIRAFCMTPLLFRW